MNKFTLEIIDLNQEERTSNGSVDFLRTTLIWKEQWTVRDAKTGRIVDRQIVERLQTTGMHGMEDRWTFCDDCGIITDNPGFYYEEEGDFCNFCETERRIEESEQEAIALLIPKRRSKAPKGCVRV